MFVWRKKIMNIHCALSDNNLDSSIVGFVERNSGFSFVKLEELKILKGIKLIFFKRNITSKNFTNLVNSLVINENNYGIFVLPPLLKEINIPEYCKKINYPIDCVEFEKIIKSIVDVNKFVYKNLSLSNTNILFNNDNMKKVYMTEIESKIVKFIFVNKKVKREILKLNILNIRPNIDTKSLDSHLSRIRKKLYEIDSNVDLVSIEPKSIQIK